MLLDELKIADNTLIIFTSDNGATDNRRSKPGASPLRTVSRVQDRCLGRRLPGADDRSLAGKIKPGTTASQFVSVTDVFATLAEITGSPVPRWAGEESFSMLPAWTGDTAPTRDQLVLRFEKRSLRA
ncbi:MAG: hypothetical protein ACOYM3_16680 [Terrimicrobiaceae bacterium]